MWGWRSAVRRHGRVGIVIWWELVNHRFGGMAMKLSRKAELAFAAACALLGAIGLTGYYITWWADSTAAVVGYPIALFGIPPAIWFILGAAFSHEFLSARGFRVRPWQFGLAAAGASLVAPLITIWGMSKPH